MNSLFWKAVPHALQLSSSLRVRQSPSSHQRRGLFCNWFSVIVKHEANTKRKKNWFLLHQELNVPLEQSPLGAIKLVLVKNCIEAQVKSWVSLPTHSAPRAAGSGFLSPHLKVLEGLYQCCLCWDIQLNPLTYFKQCLTWVMLLLVFSPADVEHQAAPPPPSFTQCSCCRSISFYRCF